MPPDDRRSIALDSLPAALQDQEAGAIPILPAPVSDRKSSVGRVVNPGDWDRLLLRARDASLLQSWRWGEFKGNSGWSPLRLAATDAQGIPSICAQLLFRNLPRLPISIAYIPRGPVYLRGDAPAPVEALCWKAIHAKARKQGAIFLKVEPNVAIESAESKAALDHDMVSRGFRPAGRLQPARTIVLDIGQSEDQLLKAMKPKTRYNVRLAERRGVLVRQAKSLEDLQAFYSLLQVTSERDEFGVHTFHYYEQLWRIFGPEGDNSALVLMAEHPEEQERAAGPVAGLLVMKFGREAIYMYGASANSGREHMPTYLLQWKAIQWAKEQGCTLYDFWGIPDAPTEDAPDSEVSPTNTRSGLRGVYWFKKGFGGREIEYPGAYDYVYNPLLYKIWMRWRGADLG